MFGRVHRPDRLQHLQEFVGARTTYLHVGASRFHLIGRPTDAEANSQASLRQNVNGAEAPRQQHGVVVRNIEDAGAQLDGAGVRGGERERVQRVEAVLVLFRQRAIGCPFPEHASQNSAPYGPRRDAPGSPGRGGTKALALLSLRTGRLASLSANLEQPPASRTPRRLHWLSERGISTVVLRSTSE